LPCADRERACKRVLETPASKRPSRGHRAPMPSHLQFPSPLVGEGWRAAPG
jgi:hypothetical protein